MALLDTVSVMPKTTVDLPDALLAEAKSRAAAERTTLREVIETALRAYLAPQPAAGKYVMPDASVGGSGLRPEFRGRSFDALSDAAYEGRGA